MTTVDPAPPSYAAGSLADVLPAVASALGVPISRVGASAPEWAHFPECRRAVVVLVDGLGYELLRRRGGHAPWLRSHLGAGARVAAGFPSTTATSMGSFGTGRLPGTHGLLGYEVLDPGQDRLLNELSWEDGPVPERWQPHETVFEAAHAAGIEVVRIGPGFFDGSGLTRAALRGGRFVAAGTLDARVDATLSALAAHPRSLVYLYWGDLDKVGHIFGAESYEWGDELEAVDRALARLAASLPADTSLTVTADHGMIDAPHDLRIDIATEPDLSAGVRHVGGEPRAVQLYTEPGAEADVRAAWSERLGHRAWLRSREEAVRDDWFGPVDAQNLARIGDLIVAMRDNFAVVDSRRARPEFLRLVGLHGSLSDDEVAIPVLHVPAGGGRRG